MEKFEVVALAADRAEGEIIFARAREAEFENFTLKTVDSGLKCRGRAALAIGAGTCLALDRQLKPGDIVASSRLVRLRPSGGLEIKEPDRLPLDWLERLRGKGFIPAGILDSGGSGLRRGADPPEYSGCRAADDESWPMAEAAETAGVPWLNLRVVGGRPGEEGETGNSFEEILETLSLKLLVALSVLDRMNPASACSGCSSCGGPCGLFR